MGGGIKRTGELTAPFRNQNLVPVGDKFWSLKSKTKKNAQKLKLVDASIHY